MPRTQGRIRLVPPPKNVSLFQATKQDRQLVEKLSGFGLTHEEITVFIKDRNGKPISINKLMRHFKKELIEGPIQAKKTIIEAFFKKVKEGNVTCIIFWLRTLGGWTKASARQPVPVVEELDPIEQYNNLSKIDKAEMDRLMQEVQNEY